MPFFKVENSPVKGMHCETFPYITRVVDPGSVDLVRIDLVIFSHASFDPVQLQMLREIVIIKHTELVQEFQAFVDKHNL